MTRPAKQPEPVAWLEHRSDELIQFFRSVISEIERGEKDEALKSLRNAIEKLRMDAAARKRL